jgi:hypothetical protein
MATATVYQAVVRLPAKSGVPKDAVQNSFCFRTADNLSANRNAVATLLDAFYRTLPATAVKKVGEYLSDTISRTAIPTVVFYDITAHLSGSSHGSPVDTIPFAGVLPAASGSALPSECSVCLSFQHVYGSDVEFAPGARPRARDRGRIYLGPLLQLAMDQDVTTRRPKVTATCMLDIGKAASVLSGSADPTWCVWSRTNATALSVDQGWVDDAFDTQRRRGEAAAVRSAWF